jgi:hypothetical protein
VKLPSNEPKSKINRRLFLGQLTAFSALFTTQSRGLWGSIRKRLPGSELAAQAANTSSWASKLSPLMTRWSSLVDPRMPHPAYPRPQLVRHDWLNLNGIWEFQPGNAADEAPIGKTLASSILVPYPVESALSGVMEHHDRLWYRRSLAIPSAWRDKKIILHFGAVDYESEVFVNGKSYGVHRGGYDPFSYDITSSLAKESTTELIVRVYDPTESGGQPRGKQNSKPRGITYTPTTGIWQTVWLEPVNPSYIEGLTMIPDIDRGVLSLTVNTSTAATHGTVEIKVKAGQSVVSTLSAASGKEIAVPVPNAHLWSPDDPFLYSLELTLKEGARVVDSVSSYFGMRKTHVGDADGQKKLLLNNKFVFQLGPLDQGFWPDGIYTAPTDDALKNDIVQMKAMGFNMVRKHIKVEPARWYYWADTLGLLVWQDMPSANSYPGNAFVPPPIDKVEFEAELKRLIETHKNSPSIVLWIVFNEGQGQFDTGRLVDLVRSLDKSRPINEASGGQIMGFGDINDVHSYPQPAVRPPNGKQALTCGEFGGIGYLIPEHSWQQSGHGYVEVATPTDLLYLYAEYIAQVKVMRDSRNLSAAIYTELTDVMTEINGLMTYDRVPKIAPEKLRQVNTFHFPAPTYKAIVPTSEKEAQLWTYTFEKPNEMWSNQVFDDSKWPHGPGPFGDHGDHVGTKWAKPDLWLRRHFNPGQLTADQVNNLLITEARQGMVEMYINGQKIDAERGNMRDNELKYEHRPISPSIRLAILPNADNVIAVHCHSNVAPQYFDAGLAIRIP